MTLRSFVECDWEGCDATSEHAYENGEWTQWLSLRLTTTARQDDWDFCPRHAEEFKKALKKEARP